MPGADLDPEDLSDQEKELERGDSVLDDYVASRGLKPFDPSKDTLGVDNLQAEVDEWDLSRTGGRRRTKSVVTDQDKDLWKGILKRYANFEQLSKDDISKLFKEFDKDGDNAINELELFNVVESMVEFVIGGVLEDVAEESINAIYERIPDHVAAAMAKLDTRGTGKISLSEFMRLNEVRLLGNEQMAEEDVSEAQQRGEAVSQQARDAEDD
jgi:hypothetical protein